MTSIHITRVGCGTPLVLLHGWGFDSRIWQANLVNLAERYEVFCIDLPGFGLSPYMGWDDFKSSLFCQLPSTFALAGWSLGGLVATRLALEETHRVTHLINIASSPCFVQVDEWPGVAKASLGLFCERLERTPNQVLQEFMALQFPGNKASVFAAPTVAGLQMGLEWLSTWDLRRELVNIKIPVLYLFGRLDAIVPGKTMKVMQALYPNFQYVMFGRAAHTLFLSHQEMFLSELNRFLV